MAPRRQKSTCTCATRDKPDAARGARGGAAGNVIDAHQLLAQSRRIEQSLIPAVGAAVEQRAGAALLANKMVQIIKLLEQLDSPPEHAVKSVPRALRDNRSRA